jgi:histidine triad (HIT) family protein
MSDCIFCRIVAGTIPSIRICEDDSAIAFMDIRPIQPGHALVIPRKHVECVIDLEPADYDGVMRMAQRIGRAIDAEWKPPKVGMAVIGFDVPHAHVHVLPLLTISDLTSGRLLDGSLKNGVIEELKRTGEQLRARLG